MDSQPSSSASQAESDTGRPKRAKKRNTRFDIDDAISIPIKSNKRNKQASKSSDNGSFWQNAPPHFSLEVNLTIHICMIHSHEQIYYDFSTDSC